MARFCNFIEFLSENGRYRGHSITLEKKSARINQQSQIRWSRPIRRAALLSYRLPEPQKLSVYSTTDSFKAQNILSDFEKKELRKKHFFLVS